ncbi:putative 26S proteasome non-ATPase regulatory subunit 4 [Elsinoe ampelina]|uniref:Putative 26S proteasome non-ATPase regulatory subunit 4 n=1 Tax=Elsinoe ampelina TaxID=302913 RepID=A0A6A6GLI9_9PEZI|nr:putative 26S proteasome non-ATPase regulatory subunit 4 [Elsinoe ampelina]
MGLEATMMIVDNSESSRNGDYVPSRWEAQADCVNLIFQYKSQANPESSIGLMSMGGKGPEVLTTLTTNPGKILDGLHRTKIGGEAHLHTAIMIAQLALKHRQNKSQRARIIVFTCSALTGESESQSSLVKLAKKMKKNNVSVDIVALGELGDETTSKLKAFNEAVKGGEGSHLEIVHPGPNLLSDVVVGSPILAGEGGGAAAAATNGEGAGTGGGGGDFEFGVDPSMDPELALALRMSMEEENNRQERERKAQEEREGKTQLESVPEGKEESQPLLDQDGQPSASGSGSAEKKDDKKDDGDKMDTA